MRATRRKAKPGQVLFFYGRIPGDNPEHLVLWGGGGATKRHANVVLDGLAMSRVEPDQTQAKGWKFGDSFLAQLDAAGFDTTTLEFSIRVKAPPPEPSNTTDDRPQVRSI